MRAREAKEHLNRTLGSHLCNTHETLQVLSISILYIFAYVNYYHGVCESVGFLWLCMQILDQTAASSSEKVSWEEVVKMGDQVSKQATIGILIALSILFDSSYCFCQLELYCLCYQVSFHTNLCLF